MEDFYARFHFPSGWPHCFQLCSRYGVHDTFCIYFNFKIVLNKFIRLADKLKTTYTLVGTGDLEPALFCNIGFFYFLFLFFFLFFFETAHGIII